MGKIKAPSKLVIIIISIVLLIIIGLIICSISSNGYYIKNYDHEKYYIIRHDYLGEYDLQYLNVTFNDEKLFEVKTTMSYSDYVDYCKKWNLKQKYENSDLNYVVFSYVADSLSLSIEARLAGIKYFGSKATLFIWDQASGGAINPTPPAYVIVIPTKKDFADIEIQNTYELDEYYYITADDDLPRELQRVDKPIIYLYPTEDTELSVKLGYEDKITCSYPKYETSWNVLAKTSGDLIELNTSRALYGLYYESKTVCNFEIQEDGFIVKGTDIAEFLEEKLKTLGLTEREAEEFIIYWLPKLQENEYNYIRFATMEEINKNMPLEFSVEPDTLIRVLMTYKGLDKPIEVKEQQLKTPKRTGFVAVEWGGTEIK